MTFREFFEEVERRLGLANPECVLHLIRARGPFDPYLRDELKPDLAELTVKRVATLLTASAKHNAAIGARGATLDRTFQEAHEVMKLVVDIVNEKFALQLPVPEIKPDQTQTAS